jgi:peroxiredoxin (alkyl hydroperoxide reductase subunit C)
LAEAKDGCVKPSRGPIVPAASQTQGAPQQAATKEANKMLARVGKLAPDFELSAYLDGGFKNIALSEYKGKWIVLCFYPGDFTFV